MYFTSAINNDVINDSRMAKDVATAIARFETCDWGNLPYEDKLANDDVVDTSGRILAKYSTVNGSIFIHSYVDDGEVTETVIMYCDEY